MSVAACMQCHCDTMAAMSNATPHVIVTRTTTQRELHYWNYDSKPSTLAYALALAHGDRHHKQILHPRSLPRLSPPRRYVSHNECSAAKFMCNKACNHFLITAAPQTQRKMRKIESELDLVSRKAHSSKPRQNFSCSTLLFV